MSEAAQHTPGPWEVVNGTDVYPVGDRDGRFFVADCDPDDAPLPLGDYRPGEHERTDSTYQRQMANARLIAAAPDLLEALKRIVSPAPAVSHKAPAWVYGIANAAISKAEGRA